MRYISMNSVTYVGPSRSFSQPSLSFPFNGIHFKILILKWLANCILKTQINTIFWNFTPLSYWKINVKPYNIVIIWYCACLICSTDNIAIYWDMDIYRTSLRIFSFKILIIAIYFIVIFIHFWVCPYIIGGLSSNKLL